ncbi:hypothetical protein HPB52_020629 [Rhipicephalus sanguineus]|uniref:Uncharacterized protein n=1 Tax=Rhipicephalus sanguineus TaxID=34632 RepID=A0A9D4PG68_RHISA|nr:hypothetical protein HPB52_020629 [Rhipicephalus sanguineus]
MSDSAGNDESCTDLWKSQLDMDRQCGACIQDVIVSYPTSFNPPVEEPPFQIHLRPLSSTATSRRLRGLHISESSSARLDLRGFDAIIGLETLYIDVCEIHEHFAAKIDELMEHNLTTLKNVDIRESLSTRSGLAMVENLVACECLAFWSAVCEDNIPDIDAVVRLMRVSTNLKEVSALQPIHQKHLFLIAEALETNHTLTNLSLNVEKCSSIVQLFSSLELNKYLKKLSLSGYVHYNASHTRAVASARHLAEQLLADECYDRVQLGPWTEPYLKVLSPVLASSSSSAEEILLPDIGELSLDSVSALCKALAYNKRVNHLIVDVRQEPDARVTLLCEAIKKNRHIKNLRIAIENVNSAKEILHAITVNATVTFLHITFRVVAYEEIKEAFSDMLSRNSAITGMSVWLEGKAAEQFLDSIAKAMSRNSLIVSFNSHGSHRDYVPSSILESVRRNKGALNRAIEFVLQRRDDRRGADCFELFVGRSCMMTQLSHVARITDAEARLKVVATEHPDFLVDIDTSAEQTSMATTPCFQRLSDTAGYDEPCIELCKSQLDMDRPCGASSFEETCWLWDDLTEWNRVIGALGLELEESRPAMLLLRCSFDDEADSERVATSRQASFHASWLLRHHSCIQEVILICPKSATSPLEERPLQIDICPLVSTATSRTLRGLYIRETSCARLDLRGLDAVIGLETLYIDVDKISQHFATQIDVLMEHNSAMLKSVDIWEAGKTRNRLTVVENLVACECLALKSPNSEGTMRDTNAMVHLMHFSSTLKEVTAQPIYQVDLSLIAHALTTNRTLTKLSLDVGKCASIAQLFRSLEVNNSLKDLSFCGLDYLGITMSEVSALCKALRVNKTLKTLQLLLIVDGTEEERTSLAQQLLADDCYDRVQLGPWTEPYLKILSPVLASSRSSAERILLPDIGELSLDSVSALCNALASNKRVNHLIFAVRQEPDARVALLCEMLKKNRYIERLNVRIEKADSAKEILRALTVNASVTFLSITLRVAADEETMDAFSDMLSRNDAITAMSLWLEGEDAQKFLDSVAKAMPRNRLIVNFNSGVDYRIHVPSSILESVRLNQCALNRAVEFVLQRRDDRRGEECFELFVGKACMMTHLTAVAGITDAEARLKVVAAEHRIQENYFVLTGIVRRHIVCWPADVKQIDALNPVCWRGIASFLRLTDVRSK